MRPQLHDPSINASNSSSIPPYHPHFLNDYQNLYNMHVNHQNQGIFGQSLLHTYNGASFGHQQSFNEPKVLQTAAKPRISDNDDMLISKNMIKICNTNEKPMLKKRNYTNFE